MPRAGLRTKKGVPVPEEALRRMKAHELERLFELPAPIVLAALGPERKPYTDEQVAVTELAQGDVRQAILKRRHAYWAEPMDFWWALSSIHGLHSNLEGAAVEGYQEVKVSETIDGLEVRGRIDDYTDHRVTDWKATSAWGWKDLQKGLAVGRPNDLAQVQMYIALVPLVLHEAATAGRLVYLWRDWSASSARRYSSGYPKEPLYVANLSPEEADWNACNKVLHQRVATWKQATKTPDNELPHCSELYRPDKETGLPSRCLSYCPVSEHCNQYKAIKAAAGWEVTP